MSDIVSRPFHPDPEYCCEACVFGRGEHSDWCWRKSLAAQEHERVARAIEHVKQLDAAFNRIETERISIGPGGTIYCDINRAISYGQIQLAMFEAAHEICRTMGSFTYAQVAQRVGRPQNEVEFFFEWLSAYDKEMGIAPRWYSKRKNGAGDEKGKS
jgi:hypothetical protein